MTDRSIGVSADEMREVMAEQIKEYAEKNAHQPTRKELDNGLYNGGVDYAVWYKNLWNLQKKTEKIYTIT